MGPFTRKYNIRIPTNVKIISNTIFFKKKLPAPMVLWQTPPRDRIEMVAGWSRVDQVDSKRVVSLSVDPSPVGQAQALWFGWTQFIKTILKLLAIVYFTFVTIMT